MTISATVCGISARYNLNDPTMVYPLLLLSVKSQTSVRSKDPIAESMSAPRFQKIMHYM